MIIKGSTQASTRSTKHVNIQAHEYFDHKVHIHLTIQLPWDLTTIIKPCICPSIQLRDGFDLQS